MEYYEEQTHEELPNISAGIKEEDESDEVEEEMTGLLKIRTEKAKAATGPKQKPYSRAATMTKQMRSLQTQHRKDGKNLEMATKNSRR